MKYILTIALLFLIIFSCSSDDEISKTDLDKQFQEILVLSKSEQCENSADWRVVGIGAKPCGGPTGFVAYSTAMDTVSFLELVEVYNANSRIYVEQQGLISNCMVTSPPAGIRCKNGEAVLVYNPCELVPDGGVCNAYIPKYYFDYETKECKEFIWGGCGGVVPFDTLEACKACDDGF